VRWARSLPPYHGDRQAGIGSVSDDAIVRSLRFGISRHGRVLLPFMSYAEMTDEDMTAVLSFLRTQSPVARAAPHSELSWLGKLAVNVVLGTQSPPATAAQRALPGAPWSTVAISRTPSQTATDAIRRGTSSRAHSMAPPLPAHGAEEPTAPM
jgi:hypothetical protein